MNGTDLRTVPFGPQEMRSADRLDMPDSCLMETGLAG
jgi:hypothetical protein